MGIYHKSPVGNSNGRGMKKSNQGIGALYMTIADPEKFLSCLRDPRPCLVKYPMESLPQKYLELECENGRVVTETAPLKTSCPLDSSYVNQATGRSVDRERRKRRKTPSSVSRASKKDHQGHRDESASTVVGVEEDEREWRGDHRRKHVPRFVALVLENTGSVARDHLASERTFLAYMRTSLTLVTAAIALVQIFLSVVPRDHPKTNAVHGLDTTIRTLAASTIILGMGVLFIGWCFQRS